MPATHVDVGASDNATRPTQQFQHQRRTSGGSTGGQRKGKARASPASGSSSHQHSRSASSSLHQSSASLQQYDAPSFESPSSSPVAVTAPSTLPAEPTSPVSATSTSTRASHSSSRRPPTHRRRTEGGGGSSSSSLHSPQNRTRLRRAESSRASSPGTGQHGSALSSAPSAEGLSLPSSPRPRASFTAFNNPPLSSSTTLPAAPATDTASAAGSVVSSSASDPAGPVQVNPPSTMNLPTRNRSGSGEHSQQRRRRKASGPTSAPGPSSGPATAPAPDEFAFSSLMSDLLKDPGAAAELDTIARICGRSRLSRANEYAHHREPVGSGVHVVGVDAADFDGLVADAGDGTLHAGAYAPLQQPAAQQYSPLETVAEAQGDSASERSTPVHSAGGRRSRGRWSLLGGVFEGRALSSSPGRAGQAVVALESVAAEGAGSGSEDRAVGRLMRLRGTG